jgi:hypothetical protein
MSESKAVTSMDELSRLTGITYTPYIISWHSPHFPQGSIVLPFALRPRVCFPLQSIVIAVCFAAYLTSVKSRLWVSVLHTVKNTGEHKRGRRTEHVSPKRR